jgi:hypothetical protein
MDYCVPCRRALNGTVTCPECGTYDSDMAPPSDRSGDAPAVDTAVLEVLFSEGPVSSEAPDIPWSPTPSTDVPEARRRCPPRRRKHRGRTLAAAAVAMLGGLAASSLVLQHSAGHPRTAPSPERAQVHVTKSPKASRPPERPATHPARSSVRDRNGGATQRPRAPATHREAPVSPTPAASTSPPPVKAGPTPRPSSGRPSPSASPTAPPSASPTGSISASPTGSPTPSTTSVPLPNAQGRGRPGEPGALAVPRELQLLVPDLIPRHEPYVPQQIIRVPHGGSAGSPRLDATCVGRRMSQHQADGEATASSRTGRTGSPT